MFLQLKKNSLVFLLITLSGCAQLPPDKVSFIDTSYKFVKLNNHSRESKSATVSLYQKALRPSLYSRCDFYPSDSVYAQVLAGRCGGGSSLFKTLDRFLREPDAGYLGLPMITTKHGISFVHLPENCEL